MRRKSVSVIITTHNRADLLVRTVESVLAQTYPDIEVIIVDNESTDDTRERLGAFGNRIKYFHKKNEGASSARNFGIKQSRGEYIGLLDSDDVYLPDKIKLCLDYLEKHPEAGFVHTAAHFFDDAGETVGFYSHSYSQRRRNVLKCLIEKNFICNSTVVARRSCLERSGLYDENIFGPADWDLWLRLTVQDRVGYVDVPLTKYRVSGNHILDNLEESLREEEYVLDKFFSAHTTDAVAAYRRKAFSSLYLRYAQSYLVKSDIEEAKKFFFRSLHVNRFNVKVIAMFLYFMFARTDLIKRLRVRIVRV